MYCLFRFLVSLVIALAAISTFAQEKPLKPIYDSTTDQTTYFHSPMMEVRRTDSSSQKINDRSTVGPHNIPSDYMRMVVYHKFKGKSADRPKAIVIGIESGAFADFRFQHYRNLIVSLDGQDEIDLGKMTVTGKDARIHNTIGIRFRETLELEIPVDSYKKIINSKTVSMQLADVRFGLLKDQLKSLREIAAKQLD